MTDYDALYAAVLDRPEDDTPRLVLADWFDDNDEPERAAFIRVQVELSRLGACGRDFSEGLSCHCRFCRAGGVKLRQRERELWNFGATGTWVDGIKPGFDCFQCIETETISRESYSASDPVVVYRRGFVSEVRLSLAAFVGWGCDCSDAIGGWGCPTCQNTGRVPGLALKAELFAAHPITRVVLTGREPFSYLDAPKWGWSVSAGSRDRGETSYLPEDIWGKTIDARTPGREGPNVWATRDDAMTALSDACVAYGRALAGLRSLTVGGRPA